MSIGAILAGAIPLMVAVLGASAAYTFNLELEKRRAYLKYTSDQLQYLYGPLRAVSYASSAAYKSYITRYGGKEEKIYFEANPSNPEQIKMWRHWMRTVFLPLNENMEKIIIENVHLFDDDLPKEYRDLLSHIITYKGVMSLWTEENVSTSNTIEEIRFNNMASIDFPRALDQRIRDDFERVRMRQKSLLDAAKRPSWRYLVDLIYRKPRLQRFPGQNA